VGSHIRFQPCYKDSRICFRALLLSKSKIVEHEQQYGEIEKKKTHFAKPKSAIFNTAVSPFVDSKIFCVDSIKLQRRYKKCRKGAFCKGIEARNLNINIEDDGIGSKEKRPGA
jgi:hypothetical protein